MTKQTILVLIIEANHFILGLYAAKFSLSGQFKIYAVKNLDEALRIYLKKKINVIVLGTSLIKKYNQKLLTRFSFKAAKNNTPIIVAGNIDLPSEFRLLKGGMFSFVDMMCDDLHILEAEVKRAAVFYKKPLLFQMN